MEAVRASFARYWEGVQQNIAPFSVSLVESLLIIVVLLYVGRRLQKSWREGRLSKTTTVNLGILAGRLSYLASVAVGIFWVANITGLQWSGALTFIGAISLAIAFSVQDVLKNLVAGLYLLVEHPFEVGDNIQVKDFTGRVEDVQIRTTVLRTDNGQQVIVPNSVLFSEVVVNRRDEQPEESPELASRVGLP